MIGKKKIVEKMYENAEVEADYDYFTFFDDKVHKIGRTIHLCKEELKHWLENYQKDYVAIKVIRVDKVYPPFTAEKQLELIKWLMRKKQTIQIELRLHENDYCISHITECEHNDAVEYVETGRKNTFDEALADLINELWQSLTDAEKVQIKNILESGVRE